MPGDEILLESSDNETPAESIDFELSKHLFLDFSPEDLEIITYEGGNASKKWLNSTVI